MNKELRDRLCCRMTFGTAGLRSAMGAGFCYINDLTVIQSTQVSITKYYMYTFYHTIFWLSKLGCAFLKKNNNKKTQTLYLGRYFLVNKKCRINANLWSCTRFILEVICISSRL